MTQELIERLRKMQREAWATDAEIASANALERLTTERNEYQIAADQQAGAHKVERDALGVQIDALAKDAARMQDALIWIATVYASGYEYQAKAKAAMEKQ